MVNRSGAMAVVVSLFAGCASGASLGAGGTTTSGNGGGFTVTAISDIGFRVGDNLEIGLTSNFHLGNWTRTGNAYSRLNEWAGDGSVECCGKAAPMLTFFKYVGVGASYMFAWLLATDAILAGPRLRYYVTRYAPTLYFDLGAGPSAFFDEDADRAIFGVGATAAAGYMFDPNYGVELRTTWGNIDDPQWGTVSIGLVIRPKKRFLGLFGKNDLERPPPPQQQQQQQQQPYPQPVYTPPPQPQQPNMLPPSATPPSQPH